MEKPGLEKRVSDISVKRSRGLSDLIAHFEIYNRAEGKSVNTIRWYTDNLRAFQTYLGQHGLPANLDQLNLEVVRNYTIYLQHRPRFQNHPFTPAQPETLSPKSVQGHIRTLRAFASWLHREGYTDDNRLKKIKVPKAPRTLLEPLTADEIGKILASIGNQTPAAIRNRLIFLTFLDTGLRCSELINVKVADVNFEAGYLKVMGKANKERVVPFGRRLQRELLQYIYHFRPEPISVSVDNVFLTSDGRPLSANMLRLLFSRLAQRSGVRRLHAHLCRHTFALNFITCGGDVFSLQQILGHSSLEMVRNYVNMASQYAVTRSRRFSPLDNVELRGVVTKNSGRRCKNS